MMPQTQAPSQSPSPAPGGPLLDRLADYAAYHRDRRNIATHFVGIPMIVLAVQVLLSRPSLGAAGLTPALLASLAAAVWYLRLDARFGLVMTALLALGLWAAQAMAALATPAWLGAGLGLFVVGWAFQFLGHLWEGRKPAFVDDLRGLIVGPLFVVAEAGFVLGWRAPLREAIERRAGPLRRGPGGTSSVAG